MPCSVGCHLDILVPIHFPAVYMAYYAPGANLVKAGISLPCRCDGDGFCFLVVHNIIYAVGCYSKVLTVVYARDGLAYSHHVRLCVALCSTVNAPILVLAELKLVGGNKGNLLDNMLGAVCLSNKVTIPVHVYAGNSTDKAPGTVFCKVSPRITGCSGNRSNVYNHVV